MAAGVESRIDITQADAATFDIEAGRYDTVMCLGASFVYGGLDATLIALTPGARPGGHVVVGELYWRSLPLPNGIEPEGFRSFADTLAVFEGSHLPVVSVIAASDDDWDNYVTLRFLAVQDWLDANTADPGSMRSAGSTRRTRCDMRESVG